MLVLDFKLRLSASDGQGKGMKSSLTTSNGSVGSNTILGKRSLASTSCLSSCLFQYSATPCGKKLRLSTRDLTSYDQNLDHINIEWIRKQRKTRHRLIKLTKSASISTFASKNYVYLYKIKNPRESSNGDTYLEYGCKHFNCACKLHIYYEREYFNVIKVKIINKIHNHESHEFGKDEYIPFYHNQINTAPRESILLQGILFC